MVTTAEIHGRYQYREWKEFNLLFLGPCRDSEQSSCFNRRPPHFLCTSSTWVYAPVEDNSGKNDSRNDYYRGDDADDDRRSTNNDRGGNSDDGDDKADGQI